MHTDEVLTLLQEVAADVVLPRWRSLAEGEVMEKRPGDLVTVADREAEVLLTARLHAAYPRALVVGEEATAADPTLPRGLPDAEHAFTVDPVDGTKNFVAGSPDFGMMVGELRAGVPVRSWIWQPAHRRAFVAERSAGSWADGHRLTAAPASAQEHSWRLVTSAWSRRGHAYAGLPPLVGSWVSCAIDYPHLLEGDADCLLYQTSTPWDHVPGSLLLAEAGGALVDLEGRPYTTAHLGGWVLGVADPRIAGRLLAAFAPLGRDALRR